MESRHSKLYQMLDSHINKLIYINAAFIDEAYRHYNDGIRDRAMDDYAEELEQIKLIISQYVTGQ